MPRHFEQFPSGVSLHDRLVKIASNFAALLSEHRKNDKRLVYRNSTVLIRELGELTGEHVTDVDVRAMTNFLRRRGVPIATTSKGYAFAETPEELDASIEHLSDRIAAMRAAKSELEKVKERWAEPPQLALFEEVRQ